jgi:uncharacterized protein (TIGR01777 family)
LQEALAAALPARADGDGPGDQIDLKPMKNFCLATKIGVAAAELEKWHLSPGAFRRLTPPWERMRIVEEPAEIVDGARAVIEVKAGPFWTTWIAEHEKCRLGSGFEDVQIEGPFAHWRHIHRFKPIGERECELVDEVAYGLPGGFPGRMVGGGFVRTKLERTFRYRHAVTKMDLECLESEPHGSGDAMNVLVTGAKGMVGSALEAFLRMRGHRVQRVTRHPTRHGDVRWDYRTGELDLPGEEKIDAVVHLAGENIAGGRWSEARMRRILESRRLGTRLLSETLAARDQKPEVLVSASGANFYGTQSAEPVDESSPRGGGFLSDVCEVWEGETAAAEQAGIRVVRLRLGVILSPAGGALAKMLPVFQTGLGGRLGSGGQRMPWIVLDDVIDIMHRALRDGRYEGAVNAVAPQLVTNAEFTRALAGTLGRPALFPAPAFALHTALGREMAEETLLADLAVTPGELISLGYPFRFPEIKGAFNYLLGRA